MSGDLAQGRRLPSLRKLARFHQGSLATDEKAIQILASLGFVRIRPGIGTFVSSPKDNAALLTYVWRVATPYELAVVRAAVDERTAPMVAEMVRDSPWVRRPRTLGDISFLAHERSVRRHAMPAWFLEADLAFHECVTRTVRGVELGGALYREVGKALMPTLMGRADILAADQELNDLHLHVASAMLDGRVTDAARAARAIARRELAAVAAAALAAGNAADGTLP